MVSSLFISLHSGRRFGILALHKENERTPGWLRLRIAKSLAEERAVGGGDGEFFLQGSLVCQLWNQAARPRKAAAR